MFISRVSLGRALLASATSVALTSPLLAQDGTTLLPETVVSASREPLPGARVGSAVTVFTRQDLETRQSQGVVEILREVPGVAVGRTGSFSGVGDVRIRGAEARHTLVLIDGIEVNDPSLGSSFDFSQLTAFDIERIEVLRGPQSSIWGSDAVGGVVNIVTRTPVRGFAADAFVEGGSFNTGAGGAAVRFGSDWFRGSFAATRFTTDGISSADRRLGNLESDAMRIGTVQAKAQLTPFPFLEANFAGRLTHSLGALDAFAFIPAIGFFGGADDKSRYDYDQRYGRADVKLKLFEGHWVTRAGIMYGQTRNDFIDDPGQLMNVNRAFKQKYDVESAISHAWPAFAEHRLTLLFEHERQSLISQGFDPFFPTFLSGAFTSRSYVGEYAGAFWERLFITGSFRFDDNSRFQDASTHRLTAAYLHRETATRLHASWGTGVKNPSLFELFGLFGSFVGNPDLRPERSRGWDVGVEQKFWGGRATIDLTYFNLRITDLIQSTLLTAFNLPGVTRTQGIEVTARVRVRDDLLFGGSYTWTDAEDAAGLSLVRRPRHAGSLFGTLDVLDGRGRIHVNARFNGPQQDLAFDAFFGTQRVRLDSFLLLDVAASYKLNQHVELYARIENLLDEKYQQVFTFGSPGIAAYAGLRAKLAWAP
jgi:vitamin B12 transporter